MSTIRVLPWILVILLNVQASALAIRSSESGCYANGKYYGEGDTFSPDGCNTCYCADVGGGELMSACTMMMCEPDKREAATEPEVREVVKEVAERAAELKDLSAREAARMFETRSMGLLQSKRMINECIAGGI